MTQSLNDSLAQDSAAVGAIYALIARFFTGSRFAIGGCIEMLAHNIFIEGYGIGLGSPGSYITVLCIDRELTVIILQILLAHHRLEDKRASGIRQVCFDNLPALTGIRGGVADGGEVPVQIHSKDIVSVYTIGKHKVVIRIHGNIPNGV